MLKDYEVPCKYTVLVYDYRVFKLQDNYQPRNCGSKLLLHVHRVHTFTFKYLIEINKNKYICLFLVRTNMLINFAMFFMLYHK